MIYTKYAREIFTALNTYGLRIGLRNVKHFFLQIGKQLRMFTYVYCVLFCILLITYYSKTEISSPHGKNLCVCGCGLGRLWVLLSESRSVITRNLIIERSTKG